MQFHWPLLSGTHSLFIVMTISSELIKLNYFTININKPLGIKILNEIIKLQEYRNRLKNHKFLCNRV